MRWLFILLAAMALAAAPAQGARVALVVGINDYQSIPPLEKAVGDAEAMSAKLRTLGFGVTTLVNPDRRSFNRAISTFSNALAPGDIAFFHFSGHGVEVDGNNLLLPSDIPLPTRDGQDFLIGEAIDLSSLMDRVANGEPAIRIFVIDACRDNPFDLKGVRGLGGPGGLGPVVPSRGSFILYSAGYAQTALDRLGPDDNNPTSVYTRVLLQKLGTPGASISQIARDVRTEVATLARAAGHDQFPAYYDELTEDIVLVSPLQSDVPAGEGGAVSVADLPPEPGAIVDAFSQRRRLEQLWQEGSQFEKAGDSLRHLQRTDEARRLATDYFGTDSLEYADANNMIVGALTKMGRIDDAIAASREAIRVYSAMFGSQDLRVLNEKSNLASRLAATGKIEEATSLFASITSAYDELRPEGWARVLHAHALEGYAQLVMTKGDGATAEKYAARALELVKQAGFTDRIDHGWIAAAYARVLEESGKCEAAQGVFRQAAEAMRAAEVPVTQHDHAEILAQLETGCS